MKQVLIFQGGWAGHYPREISALFAEWLTDAGYAVTVSDTQECLADAQKLLTYDLIIPCWTMGTSSGAYEKNLCAAVRAGVGIAGCHGGMCDAFRNSTDYQFMTGGQWVAHPGNDGITYTVRVTDREHEITKGIADFTITSEQYYLHVDPAVDVLAVTDFTLPHGEGTKTVTMPVAWTKYWGKGKVFYYSVGHTPKTFTDIPESAELMKRGLRWAMRE